MVAAVLYVDHANHLTPLTLAYHATASRHLTSGRTDVIPPSTSVEVDSAYCPRCLTYCDAASASSGFCQVDLDSTSSSAVCKDCPLCFSPLVVSIDAEATDDSKHLVCHYLCGHCSWSSRECGVTADADKLIQYKTDPNDPSNEGDLAKQRLVVIAEVSKQLEVCLRQKIENRNQIGEEVFKSLTNMWTEKEKVEARRQRLGLGAVDKGESKAREQTWSLEVLEQTMKDKKNQLASCYITDTSSDGLLKPGADAEIDISTNVPGATLPTSQQVAAQMIITTSTPRFRSDLLPLPVPFRARVSRRCLAEQAAGKTGILIKPKLNPLEGDSSSRVGHGQWFKKDSSAVSSVPRVQICKYGADSARQSYAMLLKVSNPTLSMIRLRFASHVLSENDEVAETKRSFIDERELQNVPIDPFGQKFVNARIYSPDSSNSIASADWLELENAEHLFLDMGKGQEKDPTDVSDWEAATVLDKHEAGTVMFRVVATRKDTAWVEMITCVESTKESVGSDLSHVAIPMGLQIEVGNGSWEASLIKKRDLPEGEIDIVTLNLVALLD